MPMMTRSGTSGHDGAHRPRRQALVAVVLRDLPLDELVRHRGSNRNAVYKLLHDARRRLKAHLESRGLSARDVLGLLGRAT